MFVGFIKPITMNFQSRFCHKLCMKNFKDIASVYWTFTTHSNIAWLAFRVKINITFEDQHVTTVNIIFRTHNPKVRQRRVRDIH